MTQSDELAIPICNASQDAGEDSTGSRDTGAPATQAREGSLASHAGEPAFVTVRSPSRRGHRIPREADAHSGVSYRTPLTEDFPSPRCVWRDYREGAAHYGERAPVAAAAYWIFAAPPLLVHMLIAVPLHCLTQRPALGWVAVAAIVITLALAGVI